MPTLPRLAPLRNCCAAGTRGSGAATDELALLQPVQAELYRLQLMEPVQAEGYEWSFLFLDYKN